MPRLSPDTLGSLPETVARPAYDRGRITPGIVHLGVGAFHRAHQAVYLDTLLAAQPDWGIIGASLRRPDTKTALEPQGGLYTLAVRDAEGTALRVIGAVLEVCDANTQREALLERMADPAIRIVCLTVTEKGYCHDPASGELDTRHPDIVHDLAHPAAPVSAPGLIAEALARRRGRGIAPFTVMSCDNLPANGRTARRIVTAFAGLRDPDLGAFVARSVAFPGTMVDRIVPATTDADRAAVSGALGVEDAWPVVTEPFSQWVIEDDFPTGRPAFEKAGAEMVEDVAPFEKMKLRMLNGAHSTMAYLGYLAGYRTMAETVADPDFRTFVADMMTREIMPTLEMPGTDLGAYRDALIARFANPVLHHRTWQIAMDGSQKLPQRLLDTIRARLERGEPSIRLALGVAAWMRFASGTDENGADIDVRDPLADRLIFLGQQARTNPDAMATAYLGLAEVFGDDLPNVAAFRQQVVTHLGHLLHEGAKRTVARVVGGSG